MAARVRSGPAMMRAGRQLPAQSALWGGEYMSTVFISYRREITAGEARALCNDLLERLGKNSVFMDVDSSVS